MISLPPVVAWLIGTMVLVFVVGVVLPGRASVRLDYALGFVPVRFTVLTAQGHAASPAAWGPLFGHTFLHGNFLHLAINSLGLAAFGAGVARRLGADGRGVGAVRGVSAFLAFYFACGVAGALAFAAANPREATLLVGASGAISGLMAAAMRFALRAFAPYGPAYGPLARASSGPVLTASLLYLGLNALTALGMTVGASGGLSIAWEAHVGGYLFGLFSFPLFDRLAGRQDAAVPGA